MFGHTGLGMLTCRIEGVACTHTYATASILASSPVGPSGVSQGLRRRLLCFLEQARSETLGRLWGNRYCKGYTQINPVLSVLFPSHDRSARSRILAGWDAAGGLSKQAAGDSFGFIGFRNQWYRRWHKSNDSDKPQNGLSGGASTLCETTRLRRVLGHPATPRILTKCGCPISRKLQLAGRPSVRYLVARTAEL
jgi:hypothetical protein